MNGCIVSDPYAKACRDGGAAFRLGIWAAIWIIPMVGLGVIGLLAKPR